MAGREAVHERLQGAAEQHLGRVLRRLGVTVGQVAMALRPAFAGIDVGDWVDPSGQTRDVMVRLAPEARERPSDLARLPIVVVSTRERPEDRLRGLRAGADAYLTKQSLVAADLVETLRRLTGS